MDEDEDFGNNRLEDVSWLCSLSESELDMLINLKKLVIQRAKVIGYEVLANKFDLKMLRALGLILIEYLKGRVKDLPVLPDLAESSTFLDGCKLLNWNPTDSFGTMTIEDLRASIDIKARKRTSERPCEEAVPNRKKQKTEES